MTASFAAELCGYRASGTPSTSDSHDSASVDWGRALFAELNVSSTAAEVAGVGTRVEELVADELSALVPNAEVGKSQPTVRFAQFAHLGVFNSFRDSFQGSSIYIENALRLLGEIKPAGATGVVRRELNKALRRATADEDRVRRLILMSPEESLLKLDVTVSTRDEGQPRLLVGLSCKWSLRTDRAQDCLAQGAKLVANRRGPMPHYATLTMEPRPSMLRLIAYGSGAIDCVYHLALPELRRAAQALADAKRNKSWYDQRDSIERMVAQGRLRDYSELTAVVAELAS